MISYDDRSKFMLGLNLDLLEDAIDWISSNLEPEDVFSDDDLREWAINNGYKEVEE